MANGTVVGIDEAKLWSMADALRNNMDAAEYKHVVLGLIFLKYLGPENLLGGASFIQILVSALIFRV